MAGTPLSNPGPARRAETYESHACQRNCLTRSVAQASTSSAAETQVDRLGEEVVEQLLEPLLADLPGQLGLGPGDEDPQPGRVFRIPSRSSSVYTRATVFGLTTSERERSRTEGSRSSGWTVPGRRPRGAGRPVAGRSAAGWTGSIWNSMGHLANCTSNHSTGAQSCQGPDPRIFSSARGCQARTASGPELKAGRQQIRAKRFAAIPATRCTLPCRLTMARVTRATASSSSPRVSRYSCSILAGPSRDTVVRSRKRSS